MSVRIIYQFFLQIFLYDSSNFMIISGYTLRRAAVSDYEVYNKNLMNQFK